MRSYAFQRKDLYGVLTWNTLTRFTYTCWPTLVSQVAKLLTKAAGAIESYVAT